MNVSYDKKRDIMRIKFQEGEYDISKETDEGLIIDMTKDHKIIAIEILDASEKIPRKSLNEVNIIAS
ncbi:DUF2283 domain-containing protein [Candidatus Woesearchaeota archaeon]|nr:DUF2283 domain-containing protein [Candidatus Woesearchaeota archaeon]